MQKRIEWFKSVEEDVVEDLFDTSKQSQAIARYLQTYWTSRNSHKVLPEFSSYGELDCNTIFTMNSATLSSIFSGSLQANHEKFVQFTTTTGWKTNPADLGDFSHTNMSYEPYRLYYAPASYDSYDEYYSTADLIKDKIKKIMFRYDYAHSVTFAQTNQVEFEESCYYPRGYPFPSVELPFVFNLPASFHHRTSFETTRTRGSIIPFLSDLFTPKNLLFVQLFSEARLKEIEYGKNIKSLETPLEGNTDTDSAEINHSFSDDAYLFSYIRTFVKKALIPNILKNVEFFSEQNEEVDSLRFLQTNEEEPSNLSQFF